MKHVFTHEAVSGWNEAQTALSLRCNPGYRLFDWQFVRMDEYGNYVILVHWVKDE